MKVFFTMTFHGNIISGKKIYQELEKLGHIHISKTFAGDIPNQYFSFNQNQRISYLQKLSEDLPKADVMVTELTVHSTTTGKLIQEAIDRKIPVLILYQEPTKGQLFHDLENIQVRLLAMKYSLDNLSEVLKEGLSYLVSNMNRRFTIILTADISKYLDEIAKKGTNRSDYIRDLIHKDMRNKKIGS